MADSTHPAPAAYTPDLLTDLQVTLPLYIQTGPTQMDTIRIGTVAATTTPDGLRIGDEEIADALGKAAAVHLERAAESDRRERARRQRRRELLQKLQLPTSEAAATDESCDTAAAAPRPEAEQREEDAMWFHARKLTSAPVPVLASAALQAYVDRDMHRARVLLSAVHEPQQRDLMHAAYDLANHLYNATGQSGMEATD